MKSSLSMVKCLLLFTRFCRDEIFSQDELISVKKTRMKFHSEIKKKKKRRVNTSSRYEIFKWVRFFIIFDVCSQIFFPKLTCLKIMTVWIQWNTSPLYKKWSPKRKRMRTTSKQSKMWKHFYYFFHFLWEVYKRLKFHFVLIFFLKVTYLVLTARN